MSKEDLNSKKRETLKKLNQESNQLTKECIRTALLYLMTMEEFDEITVTSIIKRAGVSRGGFYRNYTSKEQVLCEIGEGLFSFLIEFMEAHPYMDNPYKWYLYFFQGLREHSEAFGLLLKTQPPKEKIFYFDAERILKCFRKDESITERYRAIGITKMISEISVEWFKNGMKETPEEMAEILQKIIK